MNLSQIIQLHAIQTHFCLVVQHCFVSVSLQAINLQTLLSISELSAQDDGNVHPKVGSEIK